MTVIVLIDFRVMKSEMGIAARYLFVVVASTAVTIITYDLLVKRWQLTRFLFGMEIIN